MDIQALTQYFLQYGAVFIFVIVLLEYLNLPGFPAGIIMPLAGIWAARGQIGLGMALLLALAAGLLGSWILYGLGRLGGHVLLEWYLKKFPAQRPVIEKNFAMLERRGAIGIFISKLIPMVRTVISIPAGVIRMNFIKYSVSSALGIFVWNFFLIGAGYWLGDRAISLFS